MDADEGNGGVNFGALACWRNGGGVKMAPSGRCLLGVAVVDPWVCPLHLLNLLRGVILADVETVSDVVGRFAFFDLVGNLLALSHISCKCIAVCRVIQKIKIKP